MEKYESILKFEKYIVNEVLFKANNNYKQTEDKISFDVKIEKKTEIIEKTKMNIDLKVSIFKSEEVENYPCEMTIDLTGYFSVKSEEPKKLERNAIAILYPYVRAIVSTYTANANITPLILPAINVNKLIEAQNNEEN